MKKILDERQQLQLYRIGYYFFWFFFWGLLADIVLKAFFFHLPFAQWGLEWGLFMLGALGAAVAMSRHGIYDTHTRPGMRSYLLYALGGALIFATIFTVGNALLYSVSLADALLQWAIFAVSLFTLIFAALWLTGTYVKKRQKRLDSAFAEDEDAGPEK